MDKTQSETSTQSFLKAGLPSYWDIVADTYKVRKLITKHKFGVLRQGKHRATGQVVHLKSIECNGITDVEPLKYLIRELQFAR
jgi:hypothetical protein